MSIRISSAASPVSNQVPLRLPLALHLSSRDTALCTTSNPMLVESAQSSVLTRSEPCQAYRGGIASTIAALVLLARQVPTNRVCLGPLQRMLVTGVVGRNSFWIQ